MLNTVECQETHKITWGEQNQERVPIRLQWNSQALEGSEKEQISGESLLVGAGCLSNDKLSISGPRCPEQQVHWLRWEIFLTLVMSDKTHTTDAATGRESHWHMHPPHPPTWALSFCLEAHVSVIPESFEIKDMEVV